MNGRKLHEALRLHAIWHRAGQTVSPCRTRSIASSVPLKTKIQVLVA